MPVNHTPADSNFFDEPEPQAPVLTLAQARREDAHWARSYALERYYRHDREYEDYAPAYCAGYVGFAQYGGRYEDAERSLVANWLRIRGNSRLDLDEAGSAMRAAWRRMEQATAAADWTSWAGLAADPMPAPIGAWGEDDAEVASLDLVAAGAAQRAPAGALTAQP